MASTIGTQMKFLTFFRHKLRKLSVPYVKYFTAILIVNIAVIIAIALLASSIPPIVPLFYGLAHGEDQLVPQSFLLLPPAIAALITVINASISIVTNDQFIKRVLTGTTFAATILSTITIIKIILLVGKF